MISYPFQRFENSTVQFVDGDRGENYPNKSELLSKGDCVFLNTGNVTRTGFQFNSVDFISSDKDLKLRKGKAVRGDIIMTTRGTVGNVAFYGQEIPYDDIRINSGMLIVRPNQEEYLPYFLYLFFRSDLFRKQCLTNGSGSAQPQLPISALKNIALPRVDTSTQKKIIGVIQALDKKIDLNNQINTELEAMAKLIYDYWFVQFDFPDANGKPYKSSGGKMVYNEALKREIPEEWEAAPITQLLEIKTGKQDANHSTSNGEYHFFTCGDKALRCDDYEFEGKSILLAGNGNFNVKRYDGKFNAYQRTYVLKPDNPYYFSLVYYAVSYKTKQLSDGARGSIVKFITKGDIENIAIPIPKKEEDCFYEILNVIFDKYDLLYRENIELTELRDWLLPMLMNGQVTVKDPTS